MRSAPQAAAAADVEDLGASAGRDSGDREHGVDDGDVAGIESAKDAAQELMLERETL